MTERDRARRALRRFFVLKGVDHTPEILVGHIEEAIRDAIAEEREACAMIAGGHPTVTPGCEVCNGIRGRIASAIRARSSDCGQAGEKSP